MSTPPYLHLPDGVEATRFTAGHGATAALIASPPPGARGRPLLLVPGWTGSKEDFVAVVAPLAASGRTCVAVDLRGQYETPGPDDPDAYALSDYAADLADLAGQLGPPIHVLGHSLGGLVAQTLVAVHPETVCSLTLLCSGPGALPADRHDLLRLMADAIVEHGLPTTYEAKRAFDRDQGVDPHLPDDVEQWLRRRFVSHHPQSLRAMTLHLTEADERVDDVARTGVPVLVAFGTADDGWPPDEQRDLARRLHARVREIPGAAHSPAVEQPDALVAALVEFVTDVESGAAGTAGAGP